MRFFTCSIIWTGRTSGEQFIGKFDYAVIIDEVHYYSAKQLANFLFFILPV